MHLFIHDDYNICLFTGREKCSLLAEVCKILLADDAFKAPSPVAEQALQIASTLLEWVEQHQESAILFENKVTLSLQGCIDKQAIKLESFTVTGYGLHTTFYGLQMCMYVIGNA